MCMKSNHLVVILYIGKEAVDLIFPQVLQKKNPESQIWNLYDSVSAKKKKKKS